jgi:hypothetical protein
VGRACSKRLLTGNLLSFSAIRCPRVSLINSNLICLVPQPRCDPVVCPEFAGPPGICVCANGYDGIPEWDDDNNVWLHECVRDHLDNVTNPVRMPIAYMLCPGLAPLCRLLTPYP